MSYKIISNFYLFLKLKASQKKISVLRLKTYAELNQPDAIKMLVNNMKNFNLSYMNFADICTDYKLIDLAIEYIKKINHEELFDYKLAMFKYLEKYPEALEAIISYKSFDKKKESVDEILSKFPEFKFKVEELCVKYKVNL